MSDELINLLQAADRAAGDPPRGIDVAGRVRRRRARRRRVMSAAGTLAAIVVITSGVWTFAFRSKQQPLVTIAVGPAPVMLNVAEIRREADQLSREADLHETTLALFAKRSAEKIEQKPRPAPRERRDALADLQWQRERAAIVLVRQGDRLANDLNLPEHAAVAYRQARDTFPGTRWASVAQARLTDSQ